MKMKVVCNITQKDTWTKGKEYQIINKKNTTFENNSKITSVKIKDDANIIHWVVTGGSFTLR